MTFPNYVCSNFEAKNLIQFWGIGLLNKSLFCHKKKEKKVMFKMPFNFNQNHTITAAERVLSSACSERC
jgi:hypothetical protein